MKGKEAHYQQEASVKLQANHTRQISALEAKVSKLERDLKTASDRERQAQEEIMSLENTLSNQKRIHESDVQEAQETINNLLAKMGEFEDELKKSHFEKEESTKELEELMEALDTMKERLNREKRDKRKLEEELVYVEKKITRELREVKKSIVSEIEGPGLLSDPCARLMASDPYDADRYSRKIEVII